MTKKTQIQELIQNGQIEEAIKIINETMNEKKLGDFFDVIFDMPEGVIQKQLSSAFFKARRTLPDRLKKLWEEEKNRYAELKRSIQTGQTEKACDFLKHAKNYHVGEGFVSIVLREGIANNELVNAVLEMFLNVRENIKPEHGYWVHSLSHFNKLLWEHRLIDWIKKLYKTAFNGADELNDPNCSDRLVRDFARYALWDDDPTAYHLTNLGWLVPKYHKYDLARIKAGLFNSEESFYQWKVTTLQQLIATSETWERQELEKELQKVLKK